jgi:hypothetical protein
MAPSLWITLLLVLGRAYAAPTASESPQQNLTAYLLEKYDSFYKQTITEPSFFAQVLNGTVDPLRVAYFFEQVATPTFPAAPIPTYKIHRTRSTAAASQPSAAMHSRWSQQISLTR